MALRLELLKTKSEYLTIDDMVEIFGKSRVTIWRYEKSGKDGFPKSITLVGQKYWYKPTVDMYVQNWINNALRAAKLVQVPFTEFQKSVSLRPIEPTGGQGLRRLSP